MVDIAFYLVTEAVALRTGVIDSRYRTADGHFILDNKDLSRIRLTPEEYITGLEGVEMISKQDAMILIKGNGYATGRVTNVAPEPVSEQPAEENNKNDKEE